MLVHSDSSTATSTNAIARVPSGPELPRPFTPEDEAVLRDLQSQHGVVLRLEGNAVRDGYVTSEQARIYYDVEPGREQ